MTRSHTARRATSLWALLALLALLVAACGGGDDDASDDGGSDDTDGTDSSTPTTDEAMEPEDGGTLVFAVEADSDGYHPINNRWSISGNYVGSAIYEPLMVERGDGEMDGWLAESVTPNDDATEWTIVTKDGITFHDGTPFDAEVVKLNIDARLTNALTASANEPIESTEVIDDNTVVVTMKRPWSGYGHTLAAVGGYMAAPAMLPPNEPDPDLFVGTGPFVFGDWEPNANLTVTRNDDYWGGTPHLDGIEFQFITDVLTRASAIEAGEVDAGITGEASTILDFRDKEGFDVYEHSSEPFHVMLNSAVAPFDNPVAREALAVGTDQAAIITALGGDGVLEPVDTAFVPANPWHLEDAGYPESDQAAAQALVDQYEEETGGPLQFTINGSVGQQEQLAQALIEQWGALGIDATFEPVDQAAFIGEVVVGNYQAGLWRSHNWVDPDFNYIFWHSSNSNPPGEGISINFTHVENDDLDAALDAGRSTLDPDERRAAYDEVQQVLNEELTHIWLYGQVWGLISKDTVHGWDELVDRGLSRLDPKVVWADVWMEQ